MAVIGSITLRPFLYWYYQVFCFLFSFNKRTPYSKNRVVHKSCFLFLSTSLIPWTTLIEKNVPFISLIQFPFRFFVPFTLLLLLYLALSLNQWSEQKWFRLLSIFGILIFQHRRSRTYTSIWKSGKMKHLSVDILIYSIRRKKQGKHSSAKICLPACSFSKNHTWLSANL